MMRPAKFALSTAFLDDQEPISVAYKNFLRPPETGKFSIEASLRIGDHYNGDKSDVPFLDGKLMPAISRMIALVNAKFQPEERIYLYIPAHVTPKDRTIMVYGNDEKKFAQVFCTLRDITRAYRNDEVESLNIPQLVTETLDRVRDPSFVADFNVASRALTPERLAKMSPERLKNLYMQGEDIESVSAKAQEDAGVGRIKFDEDLDVNYLDGERERSFRLLQTYLQDKLDVALCASPHHLHCADLTGKKDQVHMAYLIGKRIAPHINEGRQVRQIWLENAHTDARNHLSTQKAQEFLQRNAGKPSLAPAFAG